MYSTYPGGTGRSPCNHPHIHEKCKYGSHSDGQRQRRPPPPYTVDMNDLFFDKANMCETCVVQNISWVVDTTESLSFTKKKAKKMKMKKRMKGIFENNLAAECRSPSEILFELKHKINQE